MHFPVGILVLDVGPDKKWSQYDTPRQNKMKHNFNFILEVRKNKNWFKTEMTMEETVWFHVLHTMEGIISELAGTLFVFRSKSVFKILGQTWAVRKKLASLPSASNVSQ